ncbi:MAG: hypothetical protein AAFV25_01905 [Bacteroidota bacterium]
MNRIALISLVLLSYTGISLGTIGKAMLTPYHVIMGVLIGLFALIMPKHRIQLFVSLLVLMMYVSLINVLNYASFKPTSLLYTLIFGIELIVLYNLIRQCSPEDIAGAFRFILISYIINIVAAFVVLSVGLGHSFLQNIFGIAHLESGSSRPMGFSSEPSYASFVISIAYMCQNHISGHHFRRSNALLSMGYVLAIVLLGSAYGMLFLALNILDWTMVYYRKLTQVSRRFFLILSVGMMGALLTAASRIESESIQRIAELAELFHNSSASMQRKMEKLQEKDPSAFARIGPTYMLLNSGQTDAFNIWWGSGAGTAGIVIPRFLQGTLIDEDDDTLDVGIIPAFIFDYGIVGFSLFVLFLVNCFSQLPLPFWLNIFLILPNANINTQLFWYGIASLLIVSVIQKTRRRTAAKSLVPQLKTQ